MPLGSRLRAIREQRQLTQEELAKLIGTHQNQIVRWETGTTQPSAEMLIRLSKTLDVSVDFLLGLVDQPKGHITENDLSAQERKLLSALDQGDLAAMLRILLAVHDNDVQTEQERRAVTPPGSDKQPRIGGTLKGAKASNQG